MMRNEATNVFTEGMISDINPLVTPNNVLTNALNATLITMNGNENVLQNDMGNAKVDTAFLPSGYVPVGMKEHGGIIYVASHNPITKKSQIGSFPSPQQLFNGEDLNVKGIKLDFNNFVEEKGNIPHIKAEYYKEKLFVDKTTGIARKFYPGDKFILTVDSIDEEIKQAVKEGVITFKLGTLTSGGNLDYIDESKLRIYTEDKGFWIFCYKNGKSIEELLKDKTLIQIYNAKTSGELLLIIEYKTIQAFNLIREYSFDEDLIKVKFFGKFDSYIETLNGYTNVNENIGLLEDNSFEVKDEIVLQGQSNKENYAISPVSVYGVLDRLKKKGTIDFSLIKPNQESSTEWRYYVTDSYLKIGWSYDYYNVDSSQYVSKIKFTFIDFQKSDDPTPLDELTGYSVDITKDYYNGSFEEVFFFGTSEIMKNYIYIVRIDRYIVNSEGEEIKQPSPYYRLLYTGTLFNDYYSLETNFNNLSPEQEIIPFTLDIKTNVETPNDYQYSQKIGTSSSYIDTAVLSPNNFKVQVDSEQTDVSNYRFGIKKKGTYNIKSTVNAYFNYSNKYAGFPKENELQEYVRNNISASVGDFDNSDLEYSNSSSSLINELSIESSKGEISFDSQSGNVGQFSLQVSTNRNILSNAGAIRNESYDTQALQPLYREDMSIADKGKLIGFTNVDGGVRCITGTEDFIQSSGTLKDNGEVIQGSRVGGGDDPSLSTANINMGNPCVNILAGRDGQNASLRFGWSSRRNPTSSNGWPEAERGDEVDKSDDFLIATWRTTKGNVRFINLGSRRTETRNIQNTGIIRTDIMLKCYLSQMLTVGTITIKGFTVGANSSNYVFHKAFNTKADITYTINNAEKTLDFYLQEDTKTIKERMNEWNDRFREIDQELNDYLPTFTINNTQPVTEQVEFGQDINFAADNNVMTCYLQSYSSVSKITTNYEAKKIYIGIPTGIADSDGIMPLQKDANGLYVASSSFTAMHDWYNVTSVLPRDINEMFKISDNNEILAEELDITTGYWVQNKDSNAPDMLRGIHFGKSKLFTTVK